MFQPKQVLQDKPTGMRHIGRPMNDGGTNFTLRVKNRHYAYPFRVHDDDDWHCSSCVFLMAEN